MPYGHLAAMNRGRPFHLVLPVKYVSVCTTLSTELTMQLNLEQKAHQPLTLVQYYFRISTYVLIVGSHVIIFCATCPMICQSTSVT